MTTADEFRASEADRRDLEERAEAFEAMVAAAVGSGAVLDRAAEQADIVRASLAAALAQVGIVATNTGSFGIAEQYQYDWVATDQLIAELGKRQLTIEPRLAVSNAYREGLESGIDAERRRIYGELVDLLWGCDRDANAVLEIVENPEDDTP